jgi:hypothetical protein
MISEWELGAALYLLLSFPQDAIFFAFILIANDINLVSGLFGADEDDLFLASSKLARREGIPRLFLAGNVGARFGIASEVRDLP